MGAPRRKNQFLQERLLLALDSSHAFLAAATGTVTCDTNANMADADTVTISDGFRTVVYEYDKAADGVAAGHVAWTAGTTAATVAANLQTAIQANQPAFAVTILGAVLTLTHNLPGAFANIASAKSSASALAVTGMSGGQGNGTGITATTTVKRWKPLNRTAVLDRAYLNVPKGVTANASSYWTIALKDGSTTLASWSTQTTNGSPGGQGSLTADTPVEMVLGAAAQRVLAAGDHLTVVCTKTGTPAALPPFTLDAELLYA